MELISQSVTFSISKRKRRSVDDTSGQEDGVDTVTASDKRLNTFITYNERHQALIVRQVRKRLVLTFPHSQHFLKDDRLASTLCDFLPGGTTPGNSWWGCAARLGLGSPNPDPVSDQNMSSDFPHLFSDLASKILIRFQTWRSSQIATYMFT